MLKKLLIIFAVCFAIAFAEDTVLNPPVDKSSTSTEKSTTTTTTELTTTPAKITTAKTTTAKPSSTTTPVPTTPITEPPTTLAPPLQGHYDIKDKTTNKTCLLVDFSIQISLTLDNKTVGVNVPVNISTEGSTCSNETDDLMLSWEQESSDNNKTVQLSFKFENNGTTHKYMISSIILSYPHLNETLNFTSSQPHFPTSLTKSYRCEKQQEIKLIEAVDNATAVLKVSHLKFQAFQSSTDGKFSAAEDCADSSSPDIVPIAVGCALVLLIVVVLIAYLLGRRRSQPRGYLSM